MQGAGRTARVCSREKHRAANKTASTLLANCTSCGLQAVVPQSGGRGWPNPWPLELCQTTQRGGGEARQVAPLAGPSVGIQRPRDRHHFKMESEAGITRATAIDLVVGQKKKVVDGRRSTQPRLLEAVGVRVWTAGDHRNLLAEGSLDQRPCEVTPGGSSACKSVATQGPQI